MLSSLHSIFPVALNFCLTGPNHCLWKEREERTQLPSLGGPTLQLRRYSFAFRQAVRKDFSLKPFQNYPRLPRSPHGREKIKESLNESGRGKLEQ